MSTELDSHGESQEDVGAEHNVARLSALYRASIQDGDLLTQYEILRAGEREPQLLNELSRIDAEVGLAAEVEGSVLDYDRIMSRAEKSVRQLEWVGVLPKIGRESAGISIGIALGMSILLPLLGWALVSSGLGRIEFFLGATVLALSVLSVLHLWIYAEGSLSASLARVSPSRVLAAAVPGGVAGVIIGLVLMGLWSTLRPPLYPDDSAFFVNLRSSLDGVKVPLPTSGNGYLMATSGDIEFGVDVIARDGNLVRRYESQEGFLPFQIPSSHSHSVFLVATDLAALSQFVDDDAVITFHNVGAPSSELRAMWAHFEVGPITGDIRN